MVRETKELNLAVHTLIHISTIGWKLILKVSSSPHDGYVGKRWVHLVKTVALIISLLFMVKDEVITWCLALEVSVINANLEVRLAQCCHKERQHFRCLRS